MQFACLFFNHLLFIFIFRNKKFNEPFLIKLYPKNQIHLIQINDIPIANPFINLYRRLTPNSRSFDEHPLVNHDFNLINTHFKKIQIKYYGFLTLVFFPFYSSNDSKIFKFLVNLDQFLFKTKIFRYFAWSVLITAKKN